MTRKDLGISLCREAGKILLNWYQKENQQKDKGIKDFALSADLESEKLIIKRIKKDFPNDQILSEELGSLTGASEYRWIIDPLDGTVNFRQGIPYFCVVLALEYKKQIVMSFIYDPLNCNFYFAQKGKGAFLNNQKIHVSKTNNLSQFFISYSTGSHNSPEKIETGLKSVERMIINCLQVRLIGSAILDLCNLACGHFDALIKIHPKYWDIAAGCLLVEEAGGKVTDFQGKRWNEQTQNLLVSNNLKHQELRNILTK